VEPHGTQPSVQANAIKQNITREAGQPFSHPHCLHSRADCYQQMETDLILSRLFTFPSGCYQQIETGLIN